MKTLNEITEKYSKSVVKNLNKENFYKITNFLLNEKCDYVDDIISDYLDLFNIEYNEFVEKYNKLNQKYNNSFLDKAREDMNLLEEFYNN